MMPAEELPKGFTKNDVISLMHKNQANALREIDAYILKNHLSKQQISRLLLELADELDAQSIVVELRDKL